MSARDPGAVFPKLGANTTVLTSQDVPYPNFPAVGPPLLGGPWVVAAARPWRTKESMPILEARSALWSLKHAARNRANRGKHVLFLVDAMAVSLLFSKGRSSQPHVNRLCRQWCATALVSRITPHLRWIPSEWNPSDDASRKFEKPRHFLPQAQRDCFRPPSKCLV